MTPALRFLAELTAAYLLIIAVVDAAYAVGWLPGGTITRAVRALVPAHPWLPWAYVALVVFGYRHFFGR